MEKLIDSTSEMESTIRVLLYMIEATWEMSDIKIKLQPSMESHSCFTDFLFMYTSNGELFFFVEVKKPATSTDLSLKTKATAQAVREAHLCTYEQQCKSIPFLLINSRVWSFGNAKPVGSKVEITNTYTLMTTSEMSKRQLVTVLKSVLKHEWPLAPAL